MERTLKNMVRNLKGKREAAKKVNELLDMQGDPLGVLSWWYQPNARLPNEECPWNELLYGDDPKVVIELAEAIVETSG